MDQLKIDEPGLVRLEVVEQVFKMRISMRPIIAELAAPEAMRSTQFFASRLDRLDSKRRISYPFSQTFSGHDSYAHGASAFREDL